MKYSYSRSLFCTGYLSVRAAYVTELYIPNSCLPACLSALHYVVALRQPSIECCIHMCTGWQPLSCRTSTDGTQSTVHRPTRPQRSPGWSGCSSTWHVEDRSNRLLHTLLDWWEREEGKQGEKGPGRTKKYIRLRGVYCGWMLHPHILLHVTYSIKTYFKGKFTIALRTWKWHLATSNWLFWQHFAWQLCNVEIHLSVHDQVNNNYHIIIRDQRVIIH